MKNSTKLFGIITLAVIIEFGITACYDTFESKKIKTKGSLTITGFDDYKGKDIIAYSYNANDSILFACGHIEEQFFNGEIVDNYIFNGSINNGQTSLKVYYIKGFEGFSDGGYKGEAEGYNGNEKGIYLEVLSNKENGYSDLTHIGYILVNFTNGKGTGVFKQGDFHEGLYKEKQLVFINGITGANIVDKTVNYVNANPKDNKTNVINYTLRLDSDVDLTANTYRILTAGNLTIIGLDMERKIKLTSAGSIFNVGANSELTLNDNINLVGYNGNNSPVVNVTGGAFYMKGNTKITGNTSSTNGGGVYVNDGTFSMSGNSSISGNTSSANGGGVYVGEKGTFRISGGKVYGSDELSSLANKASNGAVLGVASSSSIAKYGYGYYGSNILPHTDGQQLYTNNTIVGK